MGASTSKLEVGTVELSKLLVRSWIFADLAPSEIKALTEIARMRVARPKQAIFKKGDPGGPIFAVLRGRLKVITPGVGRDAAFRVIGPGDLFGEIAAFDGAERSASVTAIEPCQLAVIQPDDFATFLDRHPSVSRKLLVVLARRVRGLSERVEDRAFLDAPARLAKCMLGLADQYGKPSPEGIACELRLSQTSCSPRGRPSASSRTPRLASSSTISRR
jgi:CRP-like cAMP-binding protein